MHISFACPELTWVLLLHVYSSSINADQKTTLLASNDEVKISHCSEQNNSRVLQPENSKIWKIEREIVKGILLTPHPGIPLN